MTANPPDALVVQLLQPAAAHDGTLVAQLASLINDVYLTAESGMWRRKATRTTSSEVAGLIRAGQIVVARRDGEIVGSVRVHDVDGDASEFGMLVAAPAHRGTGVGRALLDFVERRGSERGHRAVRLEVLVPRTWSHPSKEFLFEWYGRRGYRIVRIERPEGPYPQLAPLLATPCDLQIREKPLQHLGA
ncbi:MAG TPA: GNAT family N-acetyltransferase [Streptosporangiaceae bacterium]|jgi:GNAT superfamily N-acetyltransferase